MSKKSVLIASVLIAIASVIAPQVYASADDIVPARDAVDMFNSLYGVVVKNIYEKLNTENKTLEEIEKEADAPANSEGIVSNAVGIDSSVMGAPDVAANETAPVSSEPYKVNRHLVDKWVADGIPYNALKKAVTYLEQDPKHAITNHNYLMIIDFTVPSTVQRMYLLNLDTGEVQRSLAAHGGHTGGLNATNFKNANTKESNKTTPGFHKFGEIYTGIHGLSYRLDGLEDRNSNARSKAVVLHAAKYATSNWIKKYGWLGRSSGCPAVSPETMAKLLTKKLSGSLLYNYTILDQDAAGAKKTQLAENDSKNADDKKVDAKVESKGISFKNDAKKDAKADAKATEAPKVVTTKIVNNKVVITKSETKSTESKKEVADKAATKKAAPSKEIHKKVETKKTASGKKKVASK